MKRWITALPLAVFLASCAGGPPPEPPPPPPLDPTGVYDCQLEVEGMAFSAVLTISTAEEGYQGSVDSEMGSMALSDIAVDGNRMTFIVGTPDMAVFFSVVFEGDGFTGDFDAGGSPGWVSGRKR